jgi:hypothetical protein
VLVAAEIFPGASLPEPGPEWTPVVEGLPGLMLLER